MRLPRPIETLAPSTCAAGTVVACLCLAACGSSAATLDTTPVEHAIARSILNQRRVVANVRCPAKVPRKQGQTFTCSAHFDVGSYPVYVTETNGAGHVRYGNSRPLVLLDIAKVQSAITVSILAQRHLHAVVSCPPEVIQRANLGFSCTASVSGKHYPFSVVQVNGSGRVRYEGKPSVSGRA